MIKALRREPSLLVFLLQEKTGVRPYKGVEPGDITAMSNCWIKWHEAGRLAVPGRSSK